MALHQRLGAERLDGIESATERGFVEMIVDEIVAAAAQPGTTRAHFDQTKRIAKPAFVMTAARDEMVKGQRLWHRANRTAAARSRAQAATRWRCGWIGFGRSGAGHGIARRIGLAL